MKVTRRTLARMLAFTAAVPLEAVAQTPAPQADEALKIAREELGTFSKQLAKVPLPMTTEPAFRFKP
jgi:hypothetical protein